MLELRSGRREFIFGSAMEFTTDDECTGQRASRQLKVKLQEVDINVQKIISNNKSESMFELRKMTHHQRPVSTFDNRQTLEVFLSTRLKSFQEVAASTEAAQHSGSSAPSEMVILPNAVQETSLNVSELVQQFIPPPEPNPQNLMPDEVRLDVQNLMARHIVHEVLQGPAQEAINQILREGMEQRRAHRRPRPRPRPHFQQADDGEEGGDEIGRGPSRPAGRLLLSSRTSGRRGRASGSSRNRHVHFVPQLPTPDADGHYPIPNRDQSVIVDQLRQSPALNSLGIESMDKIVSEVSNLVSQRLVTSALSGEFRGTLERHILSRAQQINHDQFGPRRMHPSQHQEQEFSYDERQPLPLAQFRELHEEMISMRGQLSELKQMVKLSFDLQLDIQRAIRQEVAATLASGLSQQNIVEGGGAQVHICPLPTLTPSVRSLITGGDRGVQVVDSGRCVICSEGVIDSVMYHCGHMCTCLPCGMEMKSKALKCPICRAPITDVIRAYTSML